LALGIIVLTAWAGRVREADSPEGNDRKKSKRKVKDESNGQKQIPCGNDRKKTKTRATTEADPSLRSG